MNSKISGHIAMLAGMMMMLDNPGYNHHKEIAINSDELRRIRDEGIKKTMQIRGIKEFNIDGEIVYARNLKNAKRKAGNLKMRIKK